MELKQDEHIEFINDTLKLIVSKAHTFGTDALLLASFAKPSKTALACDFGTGCGIIPFYWYRENLCKTIYAVDIQENAYKQLCRSLSLNGIEKILPINCDLKHRDLPLPMGKFDLITMNPPYTKENAGIVSAAESAKIARHEVMCTFEDICAAAARLLKFGGRLCICIRPERLIELSSAMQKYKIEPKRLRFVSQRDGLPPWLVLVEGKSGRKSGLIVENELHIESDEMRGIIGSYRKERIQSEA